MTKRHFLASFLMTCVLLAGCGVELTPLEQALHQLNSAHSMKIRMKNYFRGVGHEIDIEIDGKRMSIEENNQMTIMNIHYLWQTVDVYTEGTYGRWRKETMTFEELEFEPDTDDMNFNFPLEWIEADPANEKRFTIKDEEVDHYDSFIALAIGEIGYGATITSIELFITLSGEFDRIKVMIDTNAGGALLNLDFLGFDRITVDLP